MVLGAIWVPGDSVRKVGQEVASIKARHDKKSEVKWNRVSTNKLGMYEELISFFWTCSDLRFRAVVVSDKSRLDHPLYNEGSHDAFYYKMFYLTMQPFLDQNDGYNIYLDLKDTRSSRRILLLRDVLRSKMGDRDGTIIRRIQHIRSHESGILQLCDLLIGAVCYANRDLHSSPAKLRLVELVAAQARQSLSSKSPLGNRKFNVFIFDPQLAK
jgi:hypothetical protein